MPTTRGGVHKRRRFRWYFDPTSDSIRIENENGRRLTYSITEIQKILQALIATFGTRYFPLGNNVELLGKGTEKIGFGTVILEQCPDEIDRAQGASYLGVVLEECGYLQWNRQSKGIAWRLVDPNCPVETIRDRIYLQAR